MLPTTVQLIEAFEKAELPLEDRAAITAVMLRKVNALPMDNVVAVNARGQMIVSGRILEPEQAIAFRESCVALNDNTARKLIHQQIQYLAIVEGIYKGLTTDQIIFSKAALWVLEQQQNIIDTVAANRV